MNLRDNCSTEFLDATFDRYLRAHKISFKGISKYVNDVVVSQVSFSHLDYAI